MWRLKELERGMPERDPRETEFFRLPQVSDALVKEVIQNSLDARRNDEPKVKICFTFGSVSRLDVKQYLDGLIDHLRACDLLPQDFESCDSLRFLIIEDSGTTGLDGATGEDRSRPEKGRSNFFDFWWREGISGKKETRAGRWGLGKTTFHIVSRLRTFWGFTVRHDDSRRLLMGKALLKTHYLNGTGYQYYGYFTGENYTPISDAGVIRDLKQKFLISRKDDEPGFSLIIPMIDEEILFESVLKSLIIHYFYPIAKDTLEVKIREGMDDSVTIQRNNLIDVAVSRDWWDTSWEGIDVRELLQFVSDSISSSPTLEINFPDRERPEITESIFGPDLANLKQKFNNGGLVTFKVPVSIKRATEPQALASYFMVYLKKFPGLKNSEEFWIRSGIRINDIQTLGNRPVRAIVVAEDPPIATFLGDAETPAHTDWKENTEGFKEKYQNAVPLLRFIRKSVSKIVSLLDEPPHERQKDFLKEIFYIPITPEEEEGKVTTRQGKVKVERKIPSFVISHIQGGFEVSLNLAKRDISIPFRATIKVAYDVRRGNPFAQYESYDFNLSQLQVSSAGCRILSEQNNEMKIEITSRDFKLTVNGFDTNRDIVVKVTED